MALQIEDPELVAEILAESESRRISPEAVVRQALAGSKRQVQERYDDIMAFLDGSGIPKGGTPLTKDEEANILGYGPDGLCSS